MIATAGLLPGIVLKGIEMPKTALIVVDIQNDYFPGGKWQLDNVEAAADNAHAVIEAARRKGDLVIHIQHVSLEKDATFFVADTHGVQLYPKTANLPSERVVVKHHMNPYRGTDLHKILQEHGIEAVVAIGNMSHMCMDAVTRASDDFGYQTTVVHDACATHCLEFEGVKVSAQQVHAAFMAALRFGYADVVSTEAFVAANA